MTQDQRDRTPTDVVQWFEETLGQAREHIKTLRRRIRAHDNKFED